MDRNVAAATFQLPCVLEGWWYTTVWWCCKYLHFWCHSQVFIVGVWRSELQQSKAPTRRKPILLAVEQWFWSLQVSGTFFELQRYCPHQLSFTQNIRWQQCRQEGRIAQLIGLKEERPRPEGIALNPLTNGLQNSTSIPSAKCAD